MPATSNTYTAAQSTAHSQKSAPSFKRIDVKSTQRANGAVTTSLAFTQPSKHGRFSRFLSSVGCFGQADEPDDGADAAYTAAARDVALKAMEEFQRQLQSAVSPSEGHQSIPVSGVNTALRQMRDDLKPKARSVTIETLPSDATMRSLMGSRIPMGDTNEHGQASFQRINMDDVDKGTRFALNSEMADALARSAEPGTVATEGHYFSDGHIVGRYAKTGNCSVYGWVSVKPDGEAQSTRAEADSSASAPAPAQAAQTKSADAEAFPGAKITPAYLAFFA